MSRGQQIPKQRTSVNRSRVEVHTGCYGSVTFKDEKQLAG